MAIGNLTEQKFNGKNEITSIEKAYTNEDISQLDQLYYENHRIIFNFKYYVIQSYGRDLWLDMLENKEFRNFFYTSTGTYGEAVFGALVDLFVAHLNTTTFNILLEFTNYTRTVEDLDPVEIVQLM
ncbi:MAG: hypothetical protein HeimC2_36820 [Candidatus Heimdallarchaeota archaeon LC_2]|nr:MAG: hypothetical protein HeimC2_36820 [Candidatus Heimdallarchaeota archaeon LC_2]